MKQVLVCMICPRPIGHALGTNDTKTVSAMGVNAGLSMAKERNGLASLGIWHWPKGAVRTKLKQSEAQSAALQRMSVSVPTRLELSENPTFVALILWRSNGMS